MQTADWALVISLLSLLIALASFVWNVWSKFIFPKPRARVSFWVAHLIGSDPVQQFMTLNVVNFGPGEMTVDCAIARPAMRWYQRQRLSSLGLLNPIDDMRFPDRPTGPFGGGLPKRLAAGEELSLYFPYQSDTFMTHPLETVGVRDSFSQFHWAPRADFRKALDHYRRDFPRRASSGAEGKGAG